jgi:hypothetical protein
MDAILITFVVISQIDNRDPLSQYGLLAGLLRLQLGSLRGYRRGGMHVCSMYVPYRQQYPVCIIKLYVHSSAVETKTNQRYFTYCNSVLPVMQAENEGG